MSWKIRMCTAEMIIFCVTLLFIYGNIGTHAAVSYGSEHSYTTLARIVRHADLHEFVDMERDRLTEIITIPHEEYALDIAKLALATFYPAGKASRAVIDQLNGNKMSKRIENGNEKLALLLALAHKGQDHWRPARVSAGDAKGCFGDRHHDLVMAVVRAYTGLYYAYAVLEVSRDAFEDSATTVDNDNNDDIGPHSLTAGKIAGQKRKASGSLERTSRQVKRKKIDGVPENKIETLKEKVGTRIKELAQVHPAIVQWLHLTAWIVPRINVELPTDQEPTGGRNLLPNIRCLKCTLGLCAPRSHPNTGFVINYVTRSWLQDSGCKFLMLDITFPFSSGHMVELNVERDALVSSDKKRYIVAPVDSCQAKSTLEVAECKWHYRFGGTDTEEHNKLEKFFFHF